MQFAESYTISGCADPAHCGTFTRVPASCTSGDRCPGGAYEYSGNTDPTLCNGVPAYQKGGDGGPVLYRYAWSDGDTRWKVADSSALDTCAGSSLYLYSAKNGHASTPIAPAYSTGENWDGGTGWIDQDASPDCISDCGITVTAGGR